MPNNPLMNSIYISLNFLLLLAEKNLQNFITLLTHIKLKTNFEVVCVFNYLTFFIYSILFFYYQPPTKTMSIVLSPVRASPSPSPSFSSGKRASRKTSMSIGVMKRVSTNLMRNFKQ